MAVGFLLGLLRRFNPLQFVAMVSIVVVVPMLHVGSMREKAREDSVGAVVFLKGRVEPGDTVYVHASMCEQLKFYTQRKGFGDGNTYYGDTGWPCCNQKDLSLTIAHPNYLEKDVSEFAEAANHGTKWFLFTDHPEDWRCLGRDEPKEIESLLERMNCGKRTEVGFTKILIYAYTREL